MEGLPLPWDLNLECVEDGATLKVCKDSPVTVEEVAGRLARRDLSAAQRGVPPSKQRILNDRIPPDH